MALSAWITVLRQSQTENKVPYGNGKDSTKTKITFKLFTIIAAAFIYALSLIAAQAQISTISKIQAYAITLTNNGNTVKTFAIQTSSNMPGTDWITVALVHVPIDGIVTYTNFPGNATSMFYTAVQTNDPVGTLVVTVDPSSPPRAWSRSRRQRRHRMSRFPSMTSSRKEPQACCKA